MFSSKNFSSAAFFKKSGGGFTLIELLVVIVIIGVLSAILISNILDARQRSRDSRRKQDLQQIQTALEFYRSENGIYPSHVPPYNLNTIDCPTSSPLDFGGKTYMQKIPCDPKPPLSGSLSSGNYYYYLNGSTYFLMACLENENDTGSGVFDIPENVCPSARAIGLNNP